MAQRTAILIIMDGWGLGKVASADAIFAGAGKTAHDLDDGEVQCTDSRLGREFEKATESDTLRRAFLARRRVVRRVLFL